MKFIVDAQLPKTLSDFLNSKGHNSVHTLELPQQNATKDIEITAKAEQENRIIISKDNDFLETFLLFRQPAKLVLIRTGNIRNSDLALLFQENIDRICKLLEHNSLIEVYRDEIVVHV